MIFTRSVAFSDFIMRDQRQMKIVIAKIQRDDDVLYDDDDVYVKMSFFNDRIVEMSIATQKQSIAAKISRNNNRNNEKIQSISVNRIFVKSIIISESVPKTSAQRVVVKLLCRHENRKI